MMKRIVNELRTWNWEAMASQFSVHVVCSVLQGAEMNERIRELAEQAQDWADAHAPYASDEHQYFVEKFAELIVQECAERLLHDAKLTDIQTTRCVASIKEHFGVEE